MIVRKVWKNVWSDQLMVTVPNVNPEDITDGDIVEIRRFKPKVKEGKCTKCKKEFKYHTVNELWDCKLIKKK